LYTLIFKFYNCYNSKKLKYFTVVQMGASQSEIYNDDLFTEFKRDKWRRELDLGLYELWENT